MSRLVAKLTSKNQLTLPKWLVDELDEPSHFQIQFVRSRRALILWPGRVVSLEEQAEKAGIPARVLRMARKLVEEEKAARSASPS
ncbi:hypothetical protein [Roseococcus sp. YIM B11640]|uniref:hypothetical protein n=1 Tax=Roseococcus sp. YIM B11640 TaxID=3133973 RepID=UPI003C7D92A8